MGMMSEIAIEGTVQRMSVEIAKQIALHHSNPEVVAALKEVGRHALTLFEWSTPEWAKGYELLFKDGE